MNETKKSNCKSKKAVTPEEVTREYRKKSTTDPLGSYTGNSEISPTPHQDADDL